MKKVQARIRRLLRRTGWTQAELAQRLGVTPAAVSYWITGQRTPAATVHLALELIEQRVDQEAGA